MKPTQHTPCHQHIKVGDLDYTAEQINQLLSLIPYKADRKEISALISFTGQNYIGHYPSATLLKPQDCFAWALVGSLSAAAPYFFYTAGNEPEGYTAGWNNMQPVFGTYDLAQEDKEDEITSEDFMRIPLHLPLLTADRAIADEHGNRIADTYETRQAVRNHIRAVYNEQFIENPPLIMDGYITPGMLSEGVKDMLSQAGATINNVPDGEDLTTKQGVLKLSDKTYNPGAYSGLGRVYLRKNLVGGQNLLTQAMVSKPNTIYILQYDYTLDGKSITIPEGCVLSYEGGSIRDGHINYTDTLIEGKESLNNVTEAGAAIHHDNEERKLNGQGMDCIILNKTPYLTQDMVSKPNTIYIIRYNYDLNGAEITIPEGCVLQFEGGCLSNGNIHDIQIYSNSTHIFNKVNFYNVKQVLKISWFLNIQEGIDNAINNNVSLFIDTNIEISNPLIVDSKLVMYGTHMYKSRITMTDNEKPVIIIKDSNNTYRLSIKDLNISGGRIGIYCNSEQSQIIERSYFTNLLFTNTKEFGIKFENCGVGVNSFDNCIFRYCTGGIYCNGEWFNLNHIEKCRFEGLTTYPIFINSTNFDLANVTIEKCRFEALLFTKEDECAISLNNGPSAININSNYFEDISCNGVPTTPIIINGGSSIARAIQISNNLFSSNKLSEIVLKLKSQVWGVTFNGNQLSNAAVIQGSNLVKRVFCFGNNPEFDVEKCLDIPSHEINIISSKELKQRVVTKEKTIDIPFTTQGVYELVLSVLPLGDNNYSGTIICYLILRGQKGKYEVVASNFSEGDGCKSITISDIDMGNKTITINYESTIDENSYIDYRLNMILSNVGSLI